MFWKIQIILVFGIAVYRLALVCLFIVLYNVLYVFHKNVLSYHCKEALVLENGGDCISKQTKVLIGQALLFIKL